MICQRNPSGRDTLIDCQKKFHPLQSGKVERGCGHLRSVLNDLFEPRQKNCTKFAKKSIAMIGAFFLAIFYDSCQS